MPIAEPDPIQDNISRLLQQCASVQLATLNNEGAPEISYAPFIRHEDRFYLFISRLARHTANLLHSSQVALLLIQDEAEAKNIFARQRLNLQGQAQVVAYDDMLYSQILDRFEQRHGQTVALLRTLPDFLLFRIQVSSATFVQGFGQAFELDTPSLAPTRQITGK